MSYNELFMRTHALLKISENDDEVVVGCVKPSAAIEARLRRFHRKRIRTVRVELRDVASALGISETALRMPELSTSELGEAETSGSAAATRSLDTLSSAAPLDDLAHSLISHGANAGASDVCIETGTDDAVVRHRIDGVMQDESTMRAELGRAIVAKLKAMAGMDSINRSQPQDGRMSIEVAGATSDVRVSSIPIRGGESLSLRLLPESGAGSALEELGFSEAALRELRDLHRLPSGLVLVCGPGDSGKTTTVHAVLANAVASGRHVMTVEDPVEYTLAGAAQVSCAEVGIHRVDVLRAVLRQNPDVLLIGEIRDGEMLTLALRAALTGHLVFATIHAANPRQCVRRLIDLGASRESLAEATRTVLAQRLLRKLCGACNAAPRLSECPACHNLGYRERTPIADFAVCSGSLAPALAADGSGLRRDAELLLSAAATDRAEIDRVLGPVHAL